MAIDNFRCGIPCKIELIIEILTSLFCGLAVSNRPASTKSQGN